MKLRYLTAGESHGRRLTAIIEGLPSGLLIKKDVIDAELARRQGGYGRGGRMKIEKDRVEFLSGIRAGLTLGSPVSLSIENRDWPNWCDKMSPYAEENSHDHVEIKTPRPGHADLTGAIKYNTRDIRNILERASARETATRVAVGAICRILLMEFGIDIVSHVVSIGDVEADPASFTGRSTKQIRQLCGKSLLATCDKDAEARMIKGIDQAKKDGESLGGIFEVIVSNVPVGLGSHVHWDKKIDARLAMALVSIQAIKGVEIGLGFEAARRAGSRVHDEIAYSKDRSFYRTTNRAGGIEGGMTNGEDIRLRAAMKPIATLYNPLKTVHIETKDEHLATVERSDICAVPAAAVVGEAVVAIEMAAQLLEKFGADSIKELKRNYESHIKYLESF